MLAGIWAAALYLHNGSVPTLAELLKPADDRVASFQVGPAYDIVNVGLAAQQTRFNTKEFGAQLSPSDKQALLEYLKTL